jgi:hypothetical protein
MHAYVHVSHQKIRSPARVSHPHAIFLAIFSAIFPWRREEQMTRIHGSNPKGNRKEPPNGDGSTIDGTCPLAKLVKVT